MSSRFLTVWAVTATAVALLALGYALGRSGATPEPVARLNTPSGASEAATAGDQPPPAAAPLPEAFRGLPAEWRSKAEPTRRGYAILFAPERGELIVERCHHRGYMDERGHVVAEGWAFCDGVLSGTLESLTAEQAVVRDSTTGAAVDVTLAVDTEGQEPVLALQFAEHSMRLIPGSKNDYFQALEALADVQEQKNRYLQTINNREAAARRVAEETGERPEDVPVYTLPSTSEGGDGG